MTHQRLIRLREELDALEVDAFLVTDELNVRYLSGFTGDSTYLVVTQDSAAMLSDGRYETQLAEQCPDISAVIRTPTQLLGEIAVSTIREHGAKRIAIESEQMTLSGFRFLEKQFPEATWVETSGVVERHRAVKDGQEIEITRRAVAIAEEAFETLIQSLDPHQTETGFAHQLESEMRRLGATGCSFPIIAAAGAAGALPHYEPADRPLGGDDTILIDWGACYRGYASDLTRTLHIGEPSSAFRSAYEAVLESQLAAIDAIGPGVPAQEVDSAARGILNNHGLADAFKHSLGHGVGLHIHEMPRLASNNADVLRSGMIVTVEPGVYFAGEFGIRIEDDVLVTDSGCEVLSRLPKGLDDCRLML